MEADAIVDDEGLRSNDMPDDPRNGYAYSAPTDADANDEGAAGWPWPRWWK